MQVILLSDQRHLGKRGEVVEVKAGHARNYLLPQGLALEATHGNTKYFEQQRTKIDARHNQEREAAQAIANQLNGLKLTIPKRVGETETLYGSVTAGDVADGLGRAGFQVDKGKIELPEHIKQLGKYDVPVRIHGDVVATVKIWVVRP